MINEIKLFLFILSIVFELKFITEMVVKFFQEDPEPLVIKEIEKLFLYLTTAYIITYILI
jgi:hypothetical protein